VGIVTTERNNCIINITEKIKIEKVPSFSLPAFPKNGNGSIVIIIYHPKTFKWLHHSRCLPPQLKRLCRFCYLSSQNNLNGCIILITNIKLKRLHRTRSELKKRWLDFKKLTSLIHSCGASGFTAGLAL
jgi:hypothetical protein